MTIDENALSCIHIYALPWVNINNLEWTKAVLLTAQELNSPVILGVSEGAGKYMCGFKTVADMVKESPFLRMSISASCGIVYLSIATCRLLSSLSLSM